MLHKTRLFLSLFAVVAVALAAFVVFSAVSSAAAKASSAAVRSQPASSASSSVASSVAASQSDAAVVVGPQQAGLCALHKLPAGTSVDAVNGVFTAPTYTYYQVDLHFGNYTYIRYVNATNCSIIANVNGSCSSGSGCANNELAEIVVSRELASYCALHKLPAGTVVDKVIGAYYKIPKPYYRVLLHFGNYAYTRYIDATNCNIIPNPN